MRALDLEFLKSSRRPSGRGFVLSTVGVAAAFMVLSYHAQLRNEMKILEAQAEKLRESKTRGVMPVGMHLDAAAQQEVVRANDVIDQLGMPWERLFGAIEGAATERVALLGIAPDAKA